MTISATTQILHDGTKNVVMQFTGIADGNGGESNVVKVDVSELTPVPKSVKIQRVTYDVSGGVLQMACRRSITGIRTASRMAAAIPRTGTSCSPLSGSMPAPPTTSDWK